MQICVLYLFLVFIKHSKLIKSIELITAGISDIHFVTKHTRLLDS